MKYICEKNIFVFVSLVEFKPLTLTLSLSASDQGVRYVIVSMNFAVTYNYNIE